MQLIAMNVMTLRSSSRSVISSHLSIIRTLSQHSWTTHIKKIPKTKLYVPSDGITQKDTPTLAVLVGWAASNHKVLKKYTAIYDTVGIPSLCVVPSLFDMWISSKGNALTRELLHAIDSLPSSCNIVLHLFSSAPGVVLPVITQELYKYPSLALKGIIFDSGPSEFSLQTGVNAATLTLQQGGLNRITYLGSIAIGGTANLLIGKKKRQELTDALHSPLLDSVHQLYLYSSSDIVSPLKRVQSIVHSQKSLGRSVDTVVWNDTQHVKHYATHPKEYQSAVTKYLKQINVIQ